MKADKTVNIVEMLIDVMLSAASRRSLLLVNSNNQNIRTLKQSKLDCNQIFSGELLLHLIKLKEEFQIMIGIFLQEMKRLRKEFQR